MTFSKWVLFSIFYFHLSSKRSISIGIDRKNNLERMETYWLSQSENAHVILWMHGRASCSALRTQGFFSTVALYKELGRTYARAILWIENLDFTNQNTTKFRNTRTKKGPVWELCHERRKKQSYGCERDDSPGAERCKSFKLCQIHFRFIAGISFTS